MARFYGTVQGNRGEATRLGHSSLCATAQSYSGSIVVNFFGVKDQNDEDVDYVDISVGVGSTSYAGTSLYRGPVSDLLTREGQNAIVRKFAYDQLEREYKTIEEGHDGLSHQTNEA